MNITFVNSDSHCLPAKSVIQPNYYPFPIYPRSHTHSLLTLCPSSSYPILSWQFQYYRVVCTTQAVRRGCKHSTMEVFDFYMHMICFLFFYKHLQRLAKYHWPLTPISSIEYHYVCDGSIFIRLLASKYKNAWAELHTVLCGLDRFCPIKKK